MFTFLVLDIVSLKMIELYFFPSPNGIKVAIMLEECDLPHKIKFIDITKGEQFDPDFMRISPNCKIPAMIDNNGEETISLFESGAILLYLADKTGRFFPQHGPGYFQAIQWLFWQIGHLGPMAGQAHYFREFCEINDSHGRERFTNEMNRLYKVLNTQLENREFIFDSYSIIDMACWPWIKFHQWQGQDLADFPAVESWFEKVSVRPAVKRAELLGSSAMVDRDSYRNVLHNQTAQTIEKYRQAMRDKADPD